MIKSQLKTPISVGLALGIYFGVGLFLCGISAWLFGYCKIFVSFMKTFYLGYDYTLLGAFVGLLRGFLDGFLAGFVITRLSGIFKQRMK